MTLIDNTKQVMENIIRFNSILKEDDDFIKKLSTFKHWYYYDELNLFAPSKFIGYKDNNSEKYLIGIVSENPVYYTDGRDTQRVLKKFYKRVDDELYKKLYIKLEGMLELYDKKPNKRVGIYIQK